MTAPQMIESSIRSRALCGEKVNSSAVWGIVSKPTYSQWVRASTISTQARGERSSAKNGSRLLKLELSAWMVPNVSTSTPMVRAKARKT